MLELVAVFLVTLVLAAISVWTYRKIASWHGFKQVVVGRPRTKVRMKLRAQQGYISLAPPVRKSVQRVVRRKVTGGLRAPWGW